MKVGILKDIKVGENRVIATPVEISSLTADGHEVLVQKGAGARAGFPDEKYALAGAKTCRYSKRIYDTCDFVAKVKNLSRQNMTCSVRIRLCSPVSIRQLIRKKYRRFWTKR